MEITIGSKIIIRLNEEMKEFQVVGSADVDAGSGKISYLSPIGEAVLGKKMGDEFFIDLPEGKRINCRIIEIQ